MNIKAIITDIEGTTSSIDFVYEILFPYAKKEIKNFVLLNAEEKNIKPILEEVRQVSSEVNADLNRIIEILNIWIDTDQKITPLKSLQGHIWRHGYENGDFNGHVYDDVPSCLKSWHKLGINLYVYSSGSVEAQKLLFKHSNKGDLTSFFKGYFDTKVGKKTEENSYKNIINNIGIDANEILFLSDIEEELCAAKSVGLKTMLLERNNKKLNSNHTIINSFDEVKLNW